MTSYSRLLKFLSRNRRDVLRVAVACLIVGAVLMVVQSRWEEITTVLEETNVYVFCALMCVLPLFGVSITMVYVVVGARFGGPMGVLFIAGATVVHLAGSHLIAHSILRRPVEKLLRRRKHRLPQLAREEPVALTLLGALVPGIPYAARNFLLALSGVPFRIYFLVCWPVYVVRSGVAIVLGGWADDLTPGRMAILAGIFAFKLSVCALIVRHLYRLHGGRRPAMGKDTPPCPPGVRLSAGKRRRKVSRTMDKPVGEKGAV